MRTAIVSVLLLSAVISRSQPTITKNDMPVVGDTIHTRSTMLAMGVNYQQTGNNFTWDFSSLTSTTTGADTFIAVGSTPLIYQLAFNLPFDPNKATLASPQPDLSFIPNLPLTDIINFNRSVTALYAQCGFGATISGIPIPIKFDNPDVWYRFPLTINSLADSSESAFAQGITGLGYFSIERKRFNQVDGWGTVITPVGSYISLRVKSIVTETDSLYLDTLGFGFSLPRNYVEYKWLTTGKGLPVFQVSTQNVLPTFTWLDSSATASSFSVNLGSGVSICPGNSAVITATVTGGTPPFTYIWSDGSFGQTITVTPGATTTYTVTVVDATFQMANASTTVTVLPPPSFSITLDPNQVVGCSGGITTTQFTMTTTPTFPNYQWWNGSSGPGASSVVTGPPFPNYQGFQDYWVSVTDLQGCIGYDTIYIWWQVCTGTEELDGDSHLLEIYPNPSNGIVHIDYHGVWSSGMVLQVLDIMGREVWKRHRTEISDFVDLKQVTGRSGMFFIRLSDETGTIVRPILIQ